MQLNDPHSWSKFASQLDVCFTQLFLVCLTGGGLIIECVAGDIVFLRVLLERFADSQEVLLSICVELTKLARDVPHAAFNFESEQVFAPLLLLLDAHGGNSELTGAAMGAMAEACLKVPSARKQVLPADDSAVRIVSAMQQGAECEACAICGCQLVRALAVASERARSMLVAGNMRGNLSE